MTSAQPGPEPDAEILEARVRGVHEQIFRNAYDLTFAILDGASVKGLLGMLEMHRPEHACLLAGKLEPSTALMAPYLVQLEPRHPFTHWVIEKGWGRHWGVFASSEEDLETVRRHLKTFLMVKQPDGKRVYFRYYDPRVLRVFLPTCNVAEMETVFGPLSFWATEAENPDQLLLFERAPDGPAMRDITLADSSAAPVAGR